MKRAWVLSVGLLLIALLAVPVISALAGSIITSSSNSGNDTTLKNPSILPPRPQPSLLARIGASTKNMAGSVIGRFVKKKKSTTSPPSQFSLGSHKVGSTAESANSNAQKAPASTSDWVGLKRVSP
jgi:type IV secretory pathway TrbL component